MLLLCDCDLSPFESGKDVTRTDGFIYFSLNKVTVLIILEWFETLNIDWGAFLLIPFMYFISKSFTFSMEYSI